jgi:two-component system sensor histidine kinase KdpD
VREYLVAIAGIALVTLASVALQPITGHAAVSLLYLLLVVIAGMNLRQGPVLFIATTGALVWDYLINLPYLSFYPTNRQDLILFAIFFVVAMAMGHLTSRLRENEIAERRRERRTAALYELVQKASLTADLDGGLRAAIQLTETLFGVRAALLIRRPDHTLASEAHPGSSFAPDGQEYAVASLAFVHRIPAGKFTDTLPGSKAMHLPLLARTTAMGVLSIHPAASTIIGPSERELLEAFAVLIGTILEKHGLLEGLKHAEVVKWSRPRSACSAPFCTASLTSSRPLCPPFAPVWTLWRKRLPTARKAGQRLWRRSWHCNACTA